MTSIIISALLLAFIFILPGWSWTGQFPTSHCRAGSTTLLALVTSTALILCTSLVLSEINQFQLIVLLPILGIFTSLGIIIDYRKRGNVALLHVGQGILVCLMATGLFILLRLIPFHSDWIVGGWDPGVITNQGLCIGRTGTSHPPPGLTAPLLAMDPTGLFSRTISGLREAFPGIPVDTTTGAWDFYFCPITPLIVALLYQLGGIPLAIRMPLLVGMLAILVFTCIPKLHSAESVPPVKDSSSPPQTISPSVIPLLISILFLLQPILIYHLRTPSSEIVELLMLGSFMALWTLAKPNAPRRWLGGALLFLAAINRISFELFGAWLILIIACMDTQCDDRRRIMLDHAFLIVGLLLGIAYHEYLSPDSLAKLSHIMTSLHGSVLLLLGGVLALDRFSVRRTTPGIRWDLILLGLGLIVFVLAEQSSATPWREFGHNLGALSSYTGWLLIVIAAPGCWLLFRRPTISTFWTLFFLFALLIVLRHKHAAELYPWALKRYLVYAVPLFALLAGTTIMAVWRQRRYPWLAATLLAGVLIFNFRLCKAAWLAPDHTGISKALSEVARHINASDIIISDHFRWGTPLALAYGKNVINGESIWRTKDVATIRRAITLVQEYAGNHHDVVFLTSTDEALGIYLGAIPQTDKVWSHEPWETGRIAHHKNSRDFPASAYAIRFQLFNISTRRQDTKQ